MCCAPTSACNRATSHKEPISVKERCWRLAFCDQRPPPTNIMDFLPGAGSKKVSLGGRSRRDVRSREEVLKEAKARREAAQRQSAPGKKATIIQRYARRLFAQRRAAILLRALMTDKLMSVASTTDAAVAESQHNPQFTPLAARQLGMLWRFTSRRRARLSLTC